MSANSQLTKQAWEQLTHFQRLNKQQILDRLKTIDPSLFEHLVAILFGQQGFQTDTVGKSGDEGVDVRLTKGNASAVVQCKRYADTVGQPTVRDLYGTMLHNEADKAYLVTTAQITRQARDWAFGKPITFVDGFTLVDWILAARERPKQSWLFSRRARSRAPHVLGFTQTSGDGSESRMWLWPLVVLGILLFGVAIGVAYNSLSARWGVQPDKASTANANTDADASAAPDTQPVESPDGGSEAGTTLTPTSFTVAITTSTEVPTSAPTATFTPVVSVEPSSTAVVLIAPTPTWTPETAPAPELVCDSAVDAEFLQFYEPETMGCPQSQTGLHWAAWETFERGYLLWRSDTDVAYALFGLEEGSWFVIPERWDGSTTASRGEPPSGLLAPARGFGYVWGVRDDLFEGLGWATDVEAGFCALIQPYERGFILQSIPVDSCTAEGLFNQARSANWRPITLIMFGNGLFELQ